MLLNIRRLLKLQLHQTLRLIHHQSSRLPQMNVAELASSKVYLHVSLSYIVNATAEFVKIAKPPKRSLSTLLSWRHRCILSRTTFSWFAKQSRSEVSQLKS